MTFVDLLIVFIAFLLILPCVFKGNHGYQTIISIDSTKSLKGIMCMAIILFHIPNSIQGGILCSLINDTGYLIVGVFFFLSGYGLVAALQSKKDYVNGFLKRRILPLVPPLLIASVLYAGMYYSIGGQNLILEKVSCVENGFLIISHSWYVIVQIILYLVFFLVIKMNIIIVNTQP